MECGLFLRDRNDIAKNALRIQVQFRPVRSYYLHWDGKSIILAAQKKKRSSFWTTGLTCRAAAHTAGGGRGLEEPRNTAGGNLEFYYYDISDRITDK